MDSEKETKGLRLAFENLVADIPGGDATDEDFYLDFQNFISHFEFEIFGVGKETDIGIHSIKARIKLDDATESPNKKEEKQGATDTNEVA